MKELREIKPMSLAKVSSLMGLVYGIVADVLVFLFPSDWSTYGYLIFLAFPLTYAVVGFLSGLVGAFLYNFIAKRVGGVKFNLK